jgi:hypothetical protein
MFEQQSALDRTVIRASLGGNITQHLAGMLFALKCRQGKIVAEPFEKVYAIVHIHSKNQKHYLFYLTIGSLTAALLSYGLLASRG